MKTINPKPIIALAMLAFLTLAGRELSAQVRVTRVTGQEMLEGKKGIVYALPETRLHVDLWISRTQSFAGPLAGYAADYLGITDVILKDAISYAITEASVFTSSVADPDQVYLIEKEEKSSGEIWISFDKGPVMTLEKFDKTITPQGFASWNENLFVVPDPGKIFRKYTESPTREVVDTVIRKVSIDTLALEKKIFKYSKVQFTDKEKAQEAAAWIKQIEQDKYNLIIGYQETPYSRETMEFMLSELDRLKREYVELFAGVQVVEKLRFEFQIIPDAGQEDQKYIVSGFSKASGIVNAEGQNEITLILKNDDGSEPAVPQSKEPSVSGLVYRIPLPVKAVLSFQGKELVSKKIDVLQLGNTLNLSPEFKRLEFDLEKGAVRSVIME